MLGKFLNQFDVLIKPCSDEKGILNFSNSIVSRESTSKELVSLEE